MSDTYVAGQKLRASKIAYQKIWSLYDTVATTTFGTSEAVIAGGTAPSTTYSLNSAYLLRWRGLLKTGTAGVEIGFSVRDTSAAGTVRKTISYFACPLTTRNYDSGWDAIVANTSTTNDITGRVLVLTAAASTGATAFVNAAAQYPWSFTCYYLGAATDYPEAVAL